MKIDAPKNIRAVVERMSFDWLADGDSNGLKIRRYFAIERFQTRGPGDVPAFTRPSVTTIFGVTTSLTYRHWRGAYAVFRRVDSYSAGARGAHP